MVSTDSAEIAGVARRYGAAVPFMRSEATANDYATTWDVLEEVIASYQARGRNFDWFCCIYPTALFVTAEKLVRAYEKLRETGADSLMPVVQYSFPPQRAMVIRDGELVYQFTEFLTSRNQDLEPIYHGGIIGERRWLAWELSGYPSVGRTSTRYGKRVIIMWTRAD